MCKDKAEEKKEQFLEIFSPEDKDKVSEFYDDLLSEISHEKSIFSSCQYESVLFQLKDVIDSMYTVFLLSMKPVDHDLKLLCPLLKLFYNEIVRCYNRFADIGAAICKCNFDHETLTESADDDLKAYLEKFRKQSVQ